MGSKKNSAQFHARIIKLGVEQQDEILELLSTDLIVRKLDLKEERVLYMNDCIIVFVV